MPKRVAINGFGRIGRLCLRNLLQNENIEIVAINDLTDNKTLAHLFKYDSAQGSYKGSVDSSDEHIIIDGQRINAYTERDPKALPWASLEVDIVLECTGVFRTKEKASWHIEAGAKKVIMSAPAKSEGVETIVLGVNGGNIDQEKNCYSNASCTTNCMAPITRVILDNWGITQGNMLTVHAYTADQRLQDAPHRDLRRARAAASNIVPTSTGAAVATSIVIPEIKDKISAMAVRVPVISGSFVKLDVLTEKTTTADEVNATFKKASAGAYKGIIEYIKDPIVSSDIMGNKHSAIFDSLLTEVHGNMLSVVAWYDNEAGYSARLADLTNAIADNI